MKYSKYKVSTGNIISNDIDVFLKTLKEKTGVDKIFSCISDSSKNNEVRYVGGCVRKILNDEKVDDIDLAINIEPAKLIEILKDE